MINRRPTFSAVFFTALFLASTPHDSAAQTPEAPSNLLGPVDQIEVSERILRGNSASLQGETSRRELLLFDDGELVEQFQFVPEDNFLWRSTLEYDSQGRVVDWRSFGPGGELNWRYEYTYDRQGRRRREIVYDSSGAIDRVLTREYENGRLAEEAMYNGNDSVEWRQAYEYSDDGQTKSWSTFYADGSRIKEVTQHFDEQGRLLEEIHVNELGVAYEKIQYEYGQSSEPEVVEVYNEQNELIRHEEYEFDQNGNAVVERVTRPKEEQTELIVRNYRYDSYGNWVQRRTTRYIIRDDVRSIVAEKVVRREISYNDGSS